MAKNRNQPPAAPAPIQAAPALAPAAKEPARPVRLPKVGDTVLYVGRNDSGEVEHRAAIVSAADGDLVSLHVFPAADNAFRTAGVERDDSGKTLGTWHHRH